MTSCRRMNCPPQKKKIDACQPVAMHPKVGINPDQQLYIYYLEGRLKPENQRFQENFIGNWEEEGDSFLFFPVRPIDKSNRFCLVSLACTMSTAIR